ncbi:hypothetical protein KJ866_03220 [Patescibacteria group bacterium]|nr:hypothetical protein [Patescibacteria group bacterium]
MENPNFLKQKYDLHNAPEVAAASKRAEIKTGEKVPQNPEARIQNYLDRLERLALDPEKKQPRKMFGAEPRPRALSLLREMVMNKYVRPNKEKMAEGAARVEERAAREMGMEINYGEQELAQRGEIAVTDLEKSLDNWIAYLSDMNEPYPTWFRYYAFRNILDLGDYDKDKGEFTKRSAGSTRLFPDIDRGALAYVEQMIEASKDPAMLERLQKAQRAAALENIPQNQLITKEKAAAFAKLSFAKQYTEGIRQAGEITPEMREETRGKWIRYEQGTDPTALWASLQNKGTAWCTKGFGTAETQLNNGDFYVYYTLDKQGKPAIPRIAIRMQGENIGETRGVADNDQNLEGNMAEIAEAKMNELPGADKYRQASVDMKRLTAVEKKTKVGQELNRDDLVFLYEINSPIAYFGYQKDPRIAELRKNRDPKQDAPIVFECQPEEVAHGIKDANETTKAYIGPWNMEIFQKIRKYPNIKHLCESFPDKKIFLQTLETNPDINSPELAEGALKGKNIYLSDWGKDLLYKTEFSQEKEKYDLVRFTVEQLGFSKGATTDEIYKKAEELGLELCPAQVGPHLRLQYPGREWMLIAMKRITDRDGNPRVFSLSSDSDKLLLDGYYANPGIMWDSGSEFVFRFRKLDS